MDILSPALSLEDTFYAEGLALGKADGAKAGLVEGRRFGLEKGFEKFDPMGRLHGHSIVWYSRTTQSDHGAVDLAFDQTKMDLEQGDKDSRMCFLPQLFDKQPPSLGGDYEDLLPPISNAESVTSLPDFSVATPTSRLQKHIVTLYSLSELESLSLENTEEAVSDFEDRFRRAAAKCGIVSRIVDELVGLDQDDTGGGSKNRREADGKDGEAELEDISWRGLQTNGKQEIMDRKGSHVYNELEVEIR